MEDVGLDLAEAGVEVSAEVGLVGEEATAWVLAEPGLAVGMGCHMEDMVCHSSTVLTYTLDMPYRSLTAVTHGKRQAQQTRREMIQMPFGDGTGSPALGPMTGRGAGFCSGLGRPGFARPMPGGRLRGWRSLRAYPYYGAGYYPPYGHRHGDMYYGPGHAPYYGHPYGYPRWS